jgi:hypothetical protein
MSKCGGPFLWQGGPGEIGWQLPLLFLPGKVYVHTHVELAYTLEAMTPGSQDYALSLLVEPPPDVSWAVLVAVFQGHVEIVP